MPGIEEPRPRRILIAGGGTGGHVIPALAIARELRTVARAEVKFVGTARGMETRLVPDAGFPLELIEVGQLKNVSLKTRLRTVGDLPKGLLHCVRLLREFKPDVVMGVGGYASGPAMLAAILLRIPTLAFEPNAVPGLANRLVGRWVTAAAVNFEPTLRYFRNARVTGIPVRPEFFAVEPRPAPVRAVPGGDPVPVHLLVFGGSQGAGIFNQVMPKIVRALFAEVPGLTILHQAGVKAAEATAEEYEATGVPSSRWRVVPFLNDMPARFAEADLIVCRSGASTVAELAAAGRASVLVPFPGAADNHQLRNAEVFVGAHAAYLRVQAAAHEMESFLASDITGLLADAPLRAHMGERAKTLARPDAVPVIAGIVLELATSSR